MAEIRALKDLKSGTTFFPATIGEAVVVAGKKLTAHVKRIDAVETAVETLRTDLDTRTTWYTE